MNNNLKEGDIVEFIMTNDFVATYPNKTGIFVEIINAGHWGENIRYDSLCKINYEGKFITTNLKYVRARGKQK